MRIAEINTSHYGSTGKIMLQIAKRARNSGHEVKTFSKTWRHKPSVIADHYYLGSILENLFHRVLAPLTAREGHFSYFSTKRLLKQLDKYSPEIIHLHNLHGWYLNYKLLFNYIKERKIKVIWTLHDCWAFTGQCPYFTIVGCDNWKTGCSQCSQYRMYPETYFDNSRIMWTKKKEWFSGLDMTIVTPSQWLADLVKESFLKEYSVRVIHNGIDLNIFKPTESDFRKKHGIGDRFIVLGVAFGWGRRKGLDVFLELANRLDERFQIVLVGTNEKVDKLLPSNIISIHRTQNQTELAEIYTAADVLANPTREDNFPTVNLEALACGTPVITFRTGGSPECIDETCGSVVECDDVDALEHEIVRIYKDRPYSEACCLRRASEFGMNERFEEYVALYEQKLDDCVPF